MSEKTATKHRTGLMAAADKAKLDMAAMADLSNVTTTTLRNKTAANLDPRVIGMILAL